MSNKFHPNVWRELYCFTNCWVDRKDYGDPLDPTPRTFPRREEMYFDNHTIKELLEDLSKYPSNAYTWQDPYDNQDFEIRWDETETPEQVAERLKMAPKILKKLQKEDEEREEREKLQVQEQELKVEQEQYETYLQLKEKFEK